MTDSCLRHRDTAPAVASRRGKPDLTKKQLDDVVNLVEECVPQSVAARALGVTKQALSNRKRRKPEFRELLVKARAIAEKSLVGHMLKHAEDDFRACAWLLERTSERWRSPMDRARIAAINAELGAGDEPLQPDPRFE